MGDDKLMVCQRAVWDGSVVHVALAGDPAREARGGRHMYVMSLGVDTRITCHVRVEFPD